MLHAHAMQPELGPSTRSRRNKRTRKYRKYQCHASSLMMRPCWVSNFILSYFITHILSPFLDQFSCLLIDILFHTLAFIYIFWFQLFLLFYYTIWSFLHQWLYMVYKPGLEPEPGLGLWQALNSGLAQDFQSPSPPKPGPSRGFEPEPGPIHH